MFEWEEVALAVLAAQLADFRSQESRAGMKKVDLLICCVKLVSLGQVT